MERNLMEQNNDTGAPMTSAVVDDKKKNGNGLKITTAIACIVAVCGIGFGIYGMMSMHNNGQSSETAEESGTANNEPTNQSLDKYETRDLSRKTLRLLGSRNGLSIRDYYNNDNGNFVVLSSYMPTSQLITNSLDETSKTYITLETTMLDKEKYCSYQWTDGVKADVDAALGQQASNISFGNANIDCISYGKANGDHYDLWGESMPKINGVSNTITNGDFAYGSNSDAYYYHIIGGRGGTCSSYVVGRIAQIDKNQDSAYVDIDAGAFNICAGNAGELYSDIEKSELYKTIEQNNIDWDGLGLTEDDYKSLQSYRFVFRKNPDDIYSFSAVEKI